MVNKRIIFNNESGGISIVVPAPEMFDPQSGTRKLLPQLKDASDSEILQFIINKQGLKDYLIVDAQEIPASREFRNAWVIKAGKVDHDMEKCRALFLTKVREKRAIKLSELDLEYMRADETNDVIKKQEIAAKKQKLRDVTQDPNILKADNIDKLKAAWPEILK